MNIIAFNSKLHLWRPRLTPITEASLQSAWTFVQSLTARGNTNTLNALRAVFTDPGNVEAVYLLTDGRPDHVHFLCF